MKRVITVQDLSCIGKCSLTVALPILSVMGIETAVLPTAILSTHTAFKNFTFRDLTNDIEPIYEIWKKENIQFDAIYTGYLGSFQQIEIVSKIFNDVKKTNTLIFLDPCMGDNGKLYKGFSQKYVTAMAGLCSQADVIAPNLTEAAYLLNLPHIPVGYDKKYIESMLVQLADLGAKKIMLKGVSYSNDSIGIMAYDSTTKLFSSYFHKKYFPNFHGTGDIFASICIGALLREWPFEKTYELAADFVVQSIQNTISHENHNWYGVDFETTFPYLLTRLEKS